MIFDFCQRMHNTCMGQAWPRVCRTHWEFNLPLLTHWTQVHRKSKESKSQCFSNHPFVVGSNSSNMHKQKNQFIYMSSGTYTDFLFVSAARLHFHTPPTHRAHTTHITQLTTRTTLHTTHTRRTTHTEYTQHTSRNQQYASHNAQPTHKTQHTKDNTQNTTRDAQHPI